MSPASAAPDQPSAPTPSAFSWRRTFSRIVLLTTLLLGLWLGYQEFPREVARWYLAAAAEHRANSVHARLHGLADDADLHSKRAEAAIGESLKWDSKSAETFIVRAGWRQQQERFAEALDDYERALKLGANPRWVRDHRSVTYMLMHRYREAIDDKLAVADYIRERWWLKSERPTALNEIAYFRAVGNQDVRQGLKEINHVLAGLKKPSASLSRKERVELMACLDTRGFILYQLDRPKEAINDMDAAVRLAQLEQGDFINGGRYRQRASLDLRELELQELGFYRNLAVIYYHRSLVLAKLRHMKDAAADRRMAKQLLGGREPDESLF